MQDFVDLATKNGIILLDYGKCQFCGANTKSGVVECMEIFNFGFKSIDFSKLDNHFYKFLIVDAHSLQHPEIHGKWSNHFHLSRLHLILHYNIKWTYKLSPKLSKYLNSYKIDNQNEQLIPPEVLKRGKITTVDVIKNSVSEIECKKLIIKWASEVYIKWNAHYNVAENIAKRFLNQRDKLTF